MGANAKITTARLVAGEESPVTIEWTDGSDGRGPRTHTLELRSIEQRKQRLKGLDLAKNAVPLIASVRIAPGHETATLPIPPDAAPAYEGTIMAWRYELRVVDADAEIVEQTEASIAPGHIAAKNEPARSKALNYSKLAKNPGVDVKTSVLIGLGLLALAGGFFAFAVTASSPDDQVPLYFGGGFSVLMAAMGLFALSSLFSRGRVLGNVGVDLADNVVRRGDDVVVDLTGASSGDIEVGLIAVELVTDVSRGGGGNGTTRYSARQHRIHEQFVPYEDVPVRLAVPADGPIGYAGDGVSVHWIVRLRSKSTSAGAGGWPITVWGRQ